MTPGGATAARDANRARAAATLAPGRVKSSLGTLPVCTLLPLPPCDDFSSIIRTTRRIHQTVNSPPARRAGRAVHRPTVAPPHRRAIVSEQVRNARRDHACRPTCARTGDAKCPPPRSGGSHGHASCRIPIRVPAVAPGRHARAGAAARHSRCRARPSADQAGRDDAGRRHRRREALRRDRAREDPGRAECPQFGHAGQGARRQRCRHRRRRPHPHHRLPDRRGGRRHDRGPQGPFAGGAGRGLRPRDRLRAAAHDLPDQREARHRSAVRPSSPNAIR